MLRVLRVLPVCLLVATAAVPLDAQSADEKELAAYKITMPTMTKVVNAMRSMAEEAAKDPKQQQLMKIEAQQEDLQAQIEKLEAKAELTKSDEAKLESLNEQLEKLRAQKDEMEANLDAPDSGMNGAKTLTEMEQAINKIPAFAKALAREGLSPREYSKFTLAMLQAGMVYGFSKGKVDYAKLPPGINPENVKFIEEHQAELNAMQKEFDALGKRKRQ